MKTAISIPDSIFQAAEGLAHRLGISRSELYAKAVAEYMDSHKYQNVTNALNEVYSEEESSSLDEALNTMQMRSIPKEEW
jgi:metal-responsive CopG/Arc/MetJ family transcriptional regulator